MTEHLHERREFVRVPFSAETTIRAEGTVFTSCSSLDISLNGLLLSTTKPALQDGMVCDVEIALKGAEPPAIIAARGSIARSSPGTLAIHFIEIDLDGYQHLQQLILNNTEHPEQAEREFRSHHGIRKPAS